MALGSRRPPPKPLPRRQRPRSCVWWFLFGGILGSFGVGLYWMTQVPPGQMPPPIAALPKVERPAPQKPNFEYEKLLKETVVDTKDKDKAPPPAPRPEPPPPPPAEPEPPAAPSAGAAEPKPATPDAAKARADAAAKAKADAAAKAKAAEGGSYVLQVGSFKSAKEADAIKARLALRGVATRVSAVTLKDGQVWYRVATGRLDGKQAMESTRATLKKHGTEAVAIKLK